MREISLIDTAWQGTGVEVLPLACLMGDIFGGEGGLGCFIAQFTDQCWELGYYQPI